MGLLTVGKPLSPEETKKASKHVRDHGISQFLCTWKRVKDISEDSLRFGDEIECGIFVIDSEKKTVKMSLRAAEIRDYLSFKEDEVAHQTEGVSWHPEFGGWMIESTPSRPYSNYASELLRVERNMILRRRRLVSALKPDEIAPYMTCFPLLGVGDFIHMPTDLSVPFSQSSFVPDSVINPHPRFAALTQNIRMRRGNKVDIRIPLFRDTHTPEFLRGSASDIPTSSSTASSDPTSLPTSSASDHKLEPNTDILMDCMAFGMGMCCLQVTFQARDVDESRYMYDQLAVLAPIMLAMTAATPIFKGRLADIDCRWTAIAQSVDDRTPAERGEVSGIGLEDPLRAGGGITRLPKSRYDSVSTYIYHCKGDPDCQRTFAIYNDIPCPVDLETKQRLRSAGVDENLAHHLAHLFTRDPLVIFEGKLELDDETSTEHFENIQSTNWQTCRWKPPPPRLSAEDPHIGWRTEFRSMEVQITDFENAAFTVFVVLVTRVVLSFDLALYIPLSKVDENMRRAHDREAVTANKFFFRKHVAPPEVEEEVAISRNASSSELRELIQCSSPNVASKSMSPTSSPLSTRNDSPLPSPISLPPSAHRGESPSLSSISLDNDGTNGKSNCPPLPSEDSFEEMTTEEIFHGKGVYYPGLIPLVYAYLDYINCDRETYSRVDQYIQFISKRAKGELMTPATWIRSFVTSHPAYKHDSVVSDEIAHDLMIACRDIGEGTRHCPELLGNIQIEKIRAEDAYGSVLAGKLSSNERSVLVQRLISRAAQVSAGSPRGSVTTTTTSRQSLDFDTGDFSS